MQKRNYCLTGTSQIKKTNSCGKLGGLHAKILRGATAFSAVVVFGKLLSLFSQWVLGIYLSPEEFGTIALLTVAQMFVSAFRSIGVSKILIQRGLEFDSLAAPIFKISLAVNLIAMLLMVIAAKPLASFYEDSSIEWLLPLMAVAVPLTSASLVYRAKASVALHYKVIAKGDAVAMAVQYLSLAGLAISGFGAIAFVISFILQAATRLVLFRINVGEIPTSNLKTWTVFRQVYPSIKWIMMGSFAMSLVLRGDYLVLGKMLSALEVGTYYFGFQLAATLATLFSSSFRDILMPVFSSINGDRSAIVLMANQSTRIVLELAGIVSSYAFVLAPFAINLLWGGKWNSAIPVALAIISTVPIYLLAPLGNSIQEALGNWKERTVILLCDGAAVVACAAIGAYFYGIFGAAVLVSVERAIAAVVSLKYALKPTAGDPSVLFSVIKGYFPCFMSICAVTITWKILSDRGSYASSASLLVVVLSVATLFQVKSIINTIVWIRIKFLQNGQILGKRA